MHFHYQIVRLLLPRSYQPTPGSVDSKNIEIETTRRRPGASASHWYRDCHPAYAHAALFTTHRAGDKTKKIRVSHKSRMLLLVQLAAPLYILFVQFHNKFHRKRIAPTFPLPFNIQYFAAAPAQFLIEFLNNKSKSVKTRTHQKKKKITVPHHIIDIPFAAACPGPLRPVVLFVTSHLRHCHYRRLHNHSRVW